MAQKKSGLIQLCQCHTFYKITESLKQTTFQCYMFSQVFYFEYTYTHKNDYTVDSNK